jgi:hypothetical protein
LEESYETEYAGMSKSWPNGYTVSIVENEEGGKSKNKHFVEQKHLLSLKNAATECTYVILLGNLIF